MITSKKYFQRLKHASLWEIAYRLRHAVENRYLKWKVAGGRFQLNMPSISRDDIDSLRLPAFEGDVAGELIEALLAGTVFTLNADRRTIDNFEKQHRGTFFTAVGRNGGSPDIRAVWEPARLQHITLLLIHLVKEPQDRRAAAYAKNILLEWIANNPFLHGPQYMSAMECGLRIPVFFLTLKVLRRLSDEEYVDILKAIYQHGWWIARRLSLFSSLGNHTICELTGLVFAGAIFRSSAEGRQWLNTGISILEHEISHQILSDGGPLEQSFGYHRLVLDLGWLAVDFLGQNKLHAAGRLKERLTCGEAFWGAFAAGGGGTTSIGDCDDGHAMGPGIAIKKDQTSAVSGVYQFGRDKVDGGQDRTTFEAAGYTLMKGANGLFLTFDHGPLGMAPLYNHGHADALSITLSKNGRAFLIDPGTYRYNGAPQWRRYFKGTRAHNTATLDGKDQAVQETGFIWSRPYSVHLLRNAAVDGRPFCKAFHDGYARLNDPVIHERAVCRLDPSVFVIRDTFKGQDQHDFELNFHIHPAAVLSHSDPWWEIRHGDETVFWAIAGDWEFEHVRGLQNPIMGWFSAAYGIKEPCSVLSFRKKGLPSEADFCAAFCGDQRPELLPIWSKFDYVEKKIEYS